MGYYGAGPAYVKRMCLGLNDPESYKKGQAHEPSTLLMQDVVRSCCPPPHGTVQEPQLLVAQ